MLIQVLTPCHLSNNSHGCGYRPKIRPKNGFFCYVPFLGLIIWVTFCSNSNTLTLDSKVYIWNNLSGEKIIVIVSPLPLVGAHTKICPKYRRF